MRDSPFGEEIMDHQLQLPMNDLLKITYYQQDILWQAPEENRAKVKAALERMDGRTDIFVVPETFTTGFGDGMGQMAEEEGGETYRFMRQMAAEHDCLTVGTWVVRDGHNGRTYNRLHWVAPDGAGGHYDKAHTFRVSGEDRQVARGKERVVFEWRGWRVKPAVCYDLRFPKWLRNGGTTEEMDYDLLLVCANWPGSRHEAWTTLLKARAIENQAYAVGVNRVGCDGAEIPYTGNSVAIDYKGLVITECPAGEETTASATLEKGKLLQFRKHWPFFLDFD